MNERRQPALETTIMSIIAGAADSDLPARRAQLDRFVRQYGEPLVAHLVNSRRIDELQAEEIVQDFITDKLLVPEPSRNLARKFLEKKQRARGMRFRGYLVTSLHHYVVDRYRRNPRGIASLDAEASQPVADEAVPLDRFDVDWANNLLSQAIAKVQAECEAAGQQDIWRVFEAKILAPVRDNADPAHYDDLVQELGFRSPKEASNRLQTAIRKFNRVLRALIGDYLPVGDDSQRPQEVDEEMRELKQVLSRVAELPVGAKASEDSPPTDVSRLFQLSDDEDRLWGQPDDLQPLWEHLLQLPFEVLVRDWRLEYDLAADSPATLGQLCAAERPSLPALQAVKQFAKSAGLQTQNIEHGLPTAVLIVLYVTTVALAELRHGERITRDSNRHFLPRLKFVQEQSWLDPTTLAIARQWQATM